MNKQTKALEMAIEALKGKTDKAQAIQACKEALEQPCNMVAVPLDKLQDMQKRLSDCKEYLKEGETPAECIARNRHDTSTTLKMLAKCMGEKEALEGIPKMETTTSTIKESLKVGPAQEPTIRENRTVQEPIGYIGVISLERIKSNYSGIDGYGISLEKLLENDIPLYTRPASSREPLSDRIIDSIWDEVGNGRYTSDEDIILDDAFVYGAQWAEQVLRIKNGL